MAHQKAKIWFFTDFHGSTQCFRKFLNCVRNPNEPNVLILGGDITGKQTVPLVEAHDGSFHSVINGETIEFAKHDLPYVSKRLSDVGYYPFPCDEGQFKQYEFDQETRDRTIESLIKQRLSEWITLADSTLPDSTVCQVFVNPGNDDPLYVDDILDRSARIIRPEGKPIDLPCGLTLLSMGYSNITPWDCPRQLPEESLTARIAKMTQGLTLAKIRKSIFNFHCPPFNTALDKANKIDPITKTKVAGFKGAARQHVGSTAVRHAIEHWQPIVGLHGHIHEVHDKDTVNGIPCFNPGTSYWTGDLLGVFLQINSNGTIEVDVLTDERDPRSHGNKSKSLLDGLVSMVPAIGHAVAEHQAAAERQEILSELRELRKEVTAPRASHIPSPEAKQESLDPKAHQSPAQPSPT